MSRTGILFVVKDLEMGGGCRQAGRKKIPGIFRLEEIVDRKKISTRRVLGEGECYGWKSVSVNSVLNLFNYRQHVPVNVSSQSFIFDAMPMLV